MDIADKIWIIDSLGVTERIVSEIKNVVKSEAKEQEISRDDLYKRMVDEAVLLIHTRWIADAKCNAERYRMQETFEVSAHNVFFITQDMILYSECGVYALNPETGNCCFYDIYSFESEKEKQRYILDVMNRLPEGTKHEVKKVCHPCGGMTENYTFKVKVNKD